MNLKKALLISAVCGVFSVIMLLLYLHQLEVGIMGGGVRISVVTASADIMPNTIVEPGLVTFKKIPFEYVEPGALRSTKEIEGKVTAGMIRKGEQVTDTRLVVGGPRTGLAYKVSDGKRAVSLALEKANAAAGLIKPDDHVDVLVTFDYGDRDRAEKYTYTLFEDVAVLSVGAGLSSPRAPEGIAIVEKKKEGVFGPSSGMAATDERFSMISFELGSDDAQKLIFADSAGEISLSLRSTGDRSLAGNILPAKLEELTGRGGFLNRRFKEYRGPR